MVQKQRREARKKEREAKEAAEEAERRKTVEAEAADAAKKVQEAQRIAMMAAIELRDNQIKEEHEEDDESRIEPSDEILPQITKSDLVGGIDTGRHKLKLVDGDIDKASVITERTINSHSYPNRFSTGKKSKSDNSSTGSLLKVNKVGNIHLNISVSYI